MLKIALITNYNFAEKANAAMAVADRLIREGGEVLIAAFNREKLVRTHRHRPEFRYLPIDPLYAEADIVIVLGGDGSILEAARRAATGGTPILGINFGRLGYMAELEAGQLDELHRLFTGEYTLERRMMLRVDLLGSGGELKSFCYALNDAVVSNGSVARVIDLELAENGETVTTDRLDRVLHVGRRGNRRSFGRMLLCDTDLSAFVCGSSADLLRPLGAGDPQHLRP